MGRQVNKKRTSVWKSSVVDQTPKFSNLLEDLKKVDLFAQSVGPARYSDIYSDFVVRKPEIVVRKLEKVGRKSYLCIDKRLRP